MNNFLKLAGKRCSVREFLDKPVEDEKLVNVLEAGRIAPSAANYQPWHFVVIRQKEMILKLGNTYPRKWFLSAPVVLVICGDHEKGWKRADGKDHTDIDVAIAVDHMTLSASEEGLGTCWVCNFDSRMTSAILNLPDHIEPIVLLPLGYPVESTDSISASRHQVRNEFDKVVHWEKF